MAEATGLVTRMTRLTVVGDVLESYVFEFPGCLSRGSAKTEGNVVKSD